MVTCELCAGMMNIVVANQITCNKKYIEYVKIKTPNTAVDKLSTKRQ